jgi:hypothetical protein
MVSNNDQTGSFGLAIYYRGPIHAISDNSPASSLVADRPKTLHREPSQSSSAIGVDD